jgi:hypothetical protein
MFQYYALDIINTTTYDATTIAIQNYTILRMIIEYIATGISTTCCAQLVNNAKNSTTMFSR